MPGVRIGLIGAGAVARAVHLPILRRRSDLFTVAAICDRDEAAAGLAAARFGVPAVFTDAAAMIAATEPDAVLVLHSGSHAATVIDALTHGLGVFCEKPLAYTHDELDAIAAAAGDRAVMVGYMKCYDPAVVRAGEVLAGVDVRAVEVTVLHPPGGAQLAHSELEPEAVRATVGGPPEPVDRRAGRAGPHDAAGALAAVYTGILLGSVSHDLAVLRRLGLGVASVTGARRWTSPGGHQSVAFEGITATGADVSVRWHYLPGYPSYREEIRCHADAMSVELVFPSPYLLRAPTELRITAPAGSGAAVTTERSPVEAFEQQLVVFHDVLAGRARPVDDVATARNDLDVCQQVAAVLGRSAGLTVDGGTAR